MRHRHPGSALLLLACLITALGCARPGDDEVLRRLASVEQELSALREEIARDRAELVKRFDGLDKGLLRLVSQGLTPVPELANDTLRIGERVRRINVGPRGFRGPPRAKIRVVDYGSYQCPLCINQRTFLTDLLDLYPKEVGIAFLNYPLTRQEMGVDAGRAAWAAGRQGKFWPMHDRLFELQGNLSTETIEAQAQDLGLDMKRFRTDWTSKTSESAVYREKRLGRRLGIPGTPAYFVNRHFVGSNPVIVIDAIERILAGKPIGKNLLDPG